MKDRKVFRTGQTTGVVLSKEAAYLRLHGAPSNNLRNRTINLG